jgi:hypothetical protein
MVRVSTWFCAAVVCTMQFSALVMAGRDYYEVLGLEKTATDKDIKRVRIYLLEVLLGVSQSSGKPHPCASVNT